jgi:hypothetical protein
VKLIGRVERLDLGAGGWALVGDDGSRHALIGDVPPQYAGQKVEVEGDEAEGGGYLMTGDPAVIVSKIKKR